MIEIQRITQAQMEAGEPNPASDPAVNPTGYAEYRERLAEFLAERPFTVQSLACAVAVLRANMILPNERGLYDFTLDAEQWGQLKADNAFGIMFGKVNDYFRIRGEVDLVPLGVCLHVGGVA